MNQGQLKYLFLFLINCTEIFRNEEEFALYYRIIKWNIKKFQVSGIKPEFERFRKVGYQN